MIRDGRLVRAVFTSVRRLMVGFGLSVIIGIGVGVLSASSRRVRDALGPLVLGLQALPSVCWLPLALLWFGLGETAILFVVVIGSVLSVTISTEGAIRAIPPVYVRAARTLGARRLRLYALVILPAALPGIVTGLRLGWTFAWRSLMAGELLHVAGGLGQIIESIGFPCHLVRTSIFLDSKAVARGGGASRVEVGGRLRRTRADAGA